MNKPTNITAIVPYQVFPAKMGGQKGIAFFYRYLSRLIPVTIISTANNQTPENMDAHFLPVLGNNKLRYINPFLFFKIRKILEGNKSTHLMLEHPYYGWLGWLLQKSCNIKLVVHSHNIESVRFKSTGRWWWPILWRYEKWVHRQADINFFITDEDREFALRNFKLDPEKCHCITYGFEISAPPLSAEKLESKNKLQQIHGIDPAEKILLFNGTLDYKPNQDAIDSILNQINPILLSNEKLKYKIIICGKGLQASYDELKAFSAKNIIYAGFVDDINLYFKGADIFINPVIEGGGIKTKVVEALGYDLTVISTRSGAIGIPQSISGKKLYNITDSDWQGFANAIIQADTAEKIPASFFEQFYWGNIATKVKSILG